MEEDMQENEDVSNRNTGGKDQVHWAVNPQLCTTQWNRNGRFGGSISISISCRGAGGK